ncbi:hypothetical protein ACGC1H_002427 [Rhizoctonia solani]
MASPVGLSHPPVMIDIAQLATTIVLTAEALAAAAAALAEAAKAIMDLSQDFGGGQAWANDFTYSTNQAEGKPHVNKDRVDEHAQSNLQKEYQTEKGTGTSAFSLTDSGLDPNNEGGPSSQSCEQTRIRHTPPEGERNNSLDAFPISPKSDQSSKIDKNEPGSGPHPIDEKNGAHTHHKVADFGILVHGNKPPSPRHMIRFNQQSGGVSFMAYMALQNSKTLCIISNQKSTMGQYAKALEAITQFRVFYPITTQCVRFTNPTVQSFVAYTSPAILLLSPDQPLEIHHIGLHVDCVVYWGVPLANFCYSLRFLARSPLTISFCLVLTPGLAVNPGVYGVVEYPTRTLESIFEPGSLFDRVCETASPILTGLGLGWTTPTLYFPSTGRSSTASATQSSPPQPPLAPISRRNFQIMPPGHYYIILPSMQNSDITPLIAYIALNSLKVMCYLPDGRNVKVYNDINRIATVNAFLGKARIRNGIEQLKYSSHGVLLRSTTGNLDEHFTKGLASCLIYFGPPASPNFYARNLAPKVTHTYLVLTEAERTILPRLSLTPSIREHPLLRDLEGPVVSPVINDLRVRLSSRFGG